jgi:Mrp family chromosome partitioning ATPase
VLIDSPALNSYADAAAIGKLADGLVLVIEANATRKEAAVRVADNLRASSVNVLGAVLNKRTVESASQEPHRVEKTNRIL